MKKMGYTHTHPTHNGTLFSHKENEIMPSEAIWMNLELSILDQTKTNVI